MRRILGTVGVIASLLAVVGVGVSIGKWLENNKTDVANREVQRLKVYEQKCALFYRLFPSFDEVYKFEFQKAHFEIVKALRFTNPNNLARNASYLMNIAKDNPGVFKEIPGKTWRDLDRSASDLVDLGILVRNKDSDGDYMYSIIYDTAFYIFDRIAANSRGSPAD